MTVAWVLTYRRLHQLWSSKLGAPVAFHIWSWHDFKDLEPGIPRPLLEMALKQDKKRPQTAIHHQATTHLLWTSGGKLQFSRYPRTFRSQDLALDSESWSSRGRGLILEYCLRQGRRQLLQDLMAGYSIFKPQHYPVMLEPASSTTQVVMRDFILTTLKDSYWATRADMRNSAIWLHICVSGLTELFDLLLAKVGAPNYDGLDRAFEYACFHGHHDIVQRMLWDSDITRQAWLNYNGLEDGDEPKSYLHIIGLLETQPHIFSPEVRELVSDYDLELDFWRCQDPDFSEYEQDYWLSLEAETEDAYVWDFVYWASICVPSEDWYQNLETDYCEPAVSSHRRLDPTAAIPIGIGIKTWKSNTIL